MKKYFQITVVLGAFGLLVVFLQARRGNETPVVIPQQNNSNNSTPSSSTDTTTNTTSNTSTTGNNTTYKDGTYTGQVADAFYGNIQVQAVISNGKISDVVFLQYPNDNPTSRSINEQSNVFLKQEALTAQSAQVDIVSGASDSSRAFQQSLASALSQAQ